MRPLKAILFLFNNNCRPAESLQKLNNISYFGSNFKLVYKRMAAQLPFHGFQVALR